MSRFTYGSGSYVAVLAVAAVTAGLILSRRPA